MTGKKGKSGGARSGAGRKPSGNRCYQVRLSPERHEKFLRLGGSAWLARALDAEPMPPPPPAAKDPVAAARAELELFRFSSMPRRITVATLAGCERAADLLLRDAVFRIPRSDFDESEVITDFAAWHRREHPGEPAWDPQVTAVLNALSGPLHEAILAGRAAGDRVAAELAADLTTGHGELAGLSNSAHAAFDLAADGLGDEDPAHLLWEARENLGSTPFFSGLDDVRGSSQEDFRSAHRVLDADVRKVYEAAVQAFAEAAARF